MVILERLGKITGYRKTENELGSDLFFPFVLKGCGVYVQNKSQLEVQVVTKVYEQQILQQQIKTQILISCGKIVLFLGISR